MKSFVDDCIDFSRSLIGYGYVEGTLKQKFLLFSQQIEAYSRDIYLIYCIANKENLLTTEDNFNIMAPTLFAKIEAIINISKFLIDHRWYDNIMLEIMNKHNVSLDIIIHKIQQIREQKIRNKESIKKILNIYFKDWNIVFYVRQSEVNKEDDDKDEYTRIQYAVLKKLQLAKYGSKTFSQINEAMNEEKTQKSLLTCPQ